jgi:hypothetical protein
MIGVRRLDMFPTAHVFNLQFAIYSSYRDNIDYTPIWMLHHEYTYRQKPEIWNEGSFYRGPVFDQELSGTAGKFERVVIHEKLIAYKVHPHMFMIRYDYSYNHEEGLYKIALYFRRSLDEFENTIYITDIMSYSIIEENETAEVLNKIVESDLKEMQFPDDIRFSYNYNSNTGQLVIQCNRNFQIMYSEIDDLKPIPELLRFLNQELTMNNVMHLINPTQSKVFEDNVWNRKRAYFHTTFSTSPRNYIGMRSDFWSSPNKLFDFNNESDDFYVRFSTDGKHYFLPRYCGFIIELIYIVDINRIELICTWMNKYFISSYM